MREVVVWWARPDAPAGADRLLSPAERARPAGLRRPEDRDRFTSARLLLRLLVAGRCRVTPGSVLVHSRCDRCGGPHGRPLVTLPDGPGPPVSLSHAGRRVVVALGQQPLGVDVEPTEGSHPGLAEVALAPIEQQGLTGLDDVGVDASVLRSWVRKEAVLKATGRGLVLDPRDVIVGGPAGAPRLERWLGADPPGPVTLWDLDLAPDLGHPPGDPARPTHVAALAVLDDAATSVTVREVSLSDVAW